jgi:hypothetical protein
LGDEQYRHLRGAAALARDLAGVYGQAQRDPLWAATRRAYDLTLDELEDQLAEYDGRQFALPRPSSGSARRRSGVVSPNQCDCVKITNSEQVLSASAPRR